MRSSVVKRQNELKAKYRGQPCPVLGCNNILGISETGEKANMVAEHILPQGATRFAQFRFEEDNIAIICGCINLDLCKTMESRLEAIRVKLPNFYEKANKRVQAPWS